MFAAEDANQPTFSHKYFRKLLEIIIDISHWTISSIDDCKLPIFQSDLRFLLAPDLLPPLDTADSSDSAKGSTSNTNHIEIFEKIYREYLQFTNRYPIPLPRLPNEQEIARVDSLLKAYQSEVLLHPISAVSEEERITIQQAWRHVSTLKDPQGYVQDLLQKQGQEDGLGQAGSMTQKQQQKEIKGPKEIYAWKHFQAVLQILEHFQAISILKDPSANATSDSNVTGSGMASAIASAKSTNDSQILIHPIGHFISKLNADNELWIALLVTNPQIMKHIQTPEELASLMSCLMIDDFKVQNQFFRHPMPSNLKVKQQMN
jgi:hypothetical protein